MEKEIKELKNEIRGLKVNYISTIMIFLAYLAIKGNGPYTIFNYSISENSMFIISSFLIVLIFIKDFISYTRYTLRKILLGGGLK